MAETAHAELSIKELSDDIRAAIAELKTRPEIEDVGVVTRVGDGIAWIYGLSRAGFNEMLEIDGISGQKITAFAFNLGEDEIGAVLLGDDTDVKAGATVRLSGRVLEVPVGPELVGRVVDPLGNPLDGGDPIKTKQTSRVERPAPGVLARKSVHEPLMTGLTAIDAIVPIGRGQRELIIGDRQTGKTAIAVDTMVNQARQKTGHQRVCRHRSEVIQSGRPAGATEARRRHGAINHRCHVAVGSGRHAIPGAVHRCRHWRILPR
jgi:F-type H+-transporting ATPase subunit alpha